MHGLLVSKGTLLFFRWGGGGGGDTAFFGRGMRGEEVELYYTIPLKKTDQNGCSSFLEQTFNN